MVKMKTRLFFLISEKKRTSQRWKVSTRLSVLYFVMMMVMDGDLIKWSWMIQFIVLQMSTWSVKSLWNKRACGNSLELHELLPLQGMLHCTTDIFISVCLFTVDLFSNCCMHQLIRLAHYVRCCAMCEESNLSNEKYGLRLSWNGLWKPMPIMIFLDWSCWRSRFCAHILHFDWSSIRSFSSLKTLKDSVFCP